MNQRTVPVFNKNGKPHRQVVVPGRNYMVAAGRITLANNQGQRAEGDWDAVKALIAAGDVAIPLTPWESEMIYPALEGQKLDFGGNVDVQPARPVPWIFHPDTNGHKATFRQPGDAKLFCVECSYQAHTGLEWGQHKRQKHPDAPTSQNPVTIRRREMAKKASAKRRAERAEAKKAERRAQRQAGTTTTQVIVDEPILAASAADAE